MARFRWKGRDAQGREMSGEMAASTPEQVVSALRVQGIGVRSVDTLDEGFTEGPVDEPALRRAAHAPDQKPRPWRGVLVAGAFLLPAFGIAAIAPIVVLHCERLADGSATCVLSERVLGALTLREQALADVASVDVETKTSTSRVERQGRRTEETVVHSRIVLTNREGRSIRPDSWDQDQAVGSSAYEMRDVASAFLAAAMKEPFTAWQGQWVPLLIVGILCLIALLMLVLAAIAASRYATAFRGGLERLAAEARARRSRQTL